MKLPTHFKTPPHGYQHKGFFRRMTHVLWVTVKIAFVPILIGVAFGMTASAVGMLVGQLVVFLWMRYRKTDDQGFYEPLDADVKEVPPPYEDVPAEQAQSEKEVQAKA